MAVGVVVWLCSALEVGVVGRMTMAMMYEQYSTALYIAAQPKHWIR